MATRGWNESAVVKSTEIGLLDGWPATSNNWAQMSWSAGAKALTQTATEVPLAELALSESVLSLACGLRLIRSTEPKYDSRARLSSASTEGRRRRARRASDFLAAGAASTRVRIRPLIGTISLGEGRPALMTNARRLGTVGGNRMGRFKSA